MLVRKAFKYRLRPTGPQTAKMRQMAGTTRFLWNSALALQKEHLRRRGKILRYSEMCKELTAAKNTLGLEFLKETHSQVLQQAVKALDRALRDAFDKKQPNKRFPRFKKKGQHDSFRYPQGIKVDGRRVFLPKIGWVNFRKSRDIKGTIKNATVSRRGAHWYVAIQTEQDIRVPIHPSRSMVGIDLGAKSYFAALSKGESIEPLSVFRNLEANLAKEQRKLSRKKRFSNNWKKQKCRISRLHIRIADARRDFQHKTSTTISKSHAVVVIEDLKIANMSKSAKGTKEKPGKNVKAKSGLNKTILDQGWYEFRRQLEYKQLWRGGQVVTVSAAYTSQMCSCCGHKASENRKSQEDFLCLWCGHQEHADINAAKNIEAAGSAVLACESNLVRDRKQEPLAA